ncbi:MAG: FCD domain-containing protein [Gammaproteobacteria bacterium]|nr:MAG: FCD domain-containing protein [Gammaproteobacteria bacterium]
MAAKTPVTPDGDDKGSRDQGNKTLASAAYERIKADVTNGLFEPDQRLRIEDLRKTYGTGASPLREALSRLAAEGLIVSIGQRGFRVPSVSLDDLRDITNTRILLETEALRRSIENGDDEWEIRVVASFHRLTQVETGERPEFAVWDMANRQFHEALLSACPSRWLMRFYETMFDQHRRYRSMSIQATNTPRSVHDEHERIKDAALARDVATACEETVLHIRRTAEIDEDLLRKQIGVG